MVRSRSLLIVNVNGQRQVLLAKAKGADKDKLHLVLWYITLITINKGKDK